MWWQVLLAIVVTLVIAVPATAVSLTAASQL